MNVTRRWVCFPGLMAGTRVASSRLGNPSLCYAVPLGLVCGGAAAVMWLPDRLHRRDYKTCLD